MDVLYLSYGPYLDVSRMESGAEMSDADVTSQNEIRQEVRDVEVLLEKEIKVELLVEIYKAYLEDTHEMRQERLNADNIRVTIVTLFLGAQAYLASNILSDPKEASLRSLTLGSWVPIISIFAAGLVGYFFCINWMKLTEDYRKTLGAKYKGLLTLETTRKNLLEPLGANLFTQESEERQHAKALAAGKGSRGVNRRNQQLQEFFKVVFILVTSGMILAKLVGIAITIAQTNWHLFQ